jgi:hypothetical protein
MTIEVTSTTNTPGQPQPSTKGDILLSKDYIEHLRSIHFALIGTSIVLAFLAFSPSPSQYEEAKDRIIEIQRLDRAEVETIVDRRYEDALKSWNHSASATLLATDATVMSVPELEQNFAIVFKPPKQGFVPFITEVLGFDPSEPFDDGFQDPHSFHSLTEFRKLWESLYLHRMLALPSLAPSRVFTSPITRGTIRFGPETLFTPLTASFSKESISSVTLAFELAPCPPSLKKEITELTHAACHYMYLAGWSEKSLWLALPVEELGNALEVNPQKPFLEQNKNWVSGTFESSFAVLNQLSTNIQDLRLDSLRRVLETEATRKGDSFEAVGIKFPSETTKWAGFVVLCGIQLYFLLLLREQSGSKKEASASEGVPWMGAYESGLAKVMTFTTIVLLPSFAFTAMGFAKWNFHYAVWRTAGLSASSLLLFTLSILTWSALRSAASR